MERFRRRDFLTFSGRVLVAGAIAFQAGCGRYDAPRVTPTPESQKSLSIGEFIRQHGGANGAVETLLRRDTEAKAARPDCYVQDVNRELNALASGKPSRSYPPIPPAATTEEKTTILQIRGYEQQGLETISQKIESETQNPDTRALILGDKYAALAEIDKDTENKISPQNQIVIHELADMADCHAVKAISLTTEISIQEIKEYKKILGKQ